MVGSSSWIVRLASLKVTALIAVPVTVTARSPWSTVSGTVTSVTVPVAVMLVAANRRIRLVPSNAQRLSSSDVAETVTEKAVDWAGDTVAVTVARPASAGTSPSASAVGRDKRASPVHRRSASPA